jgi:hypothetical protein
MSSTLQRACAAFSPILVLLSSACGNSNPESASGPSCQQLLPECLSFQKSCLNGPNGGECVRCEKGEWVDQTGACIAVEGKATHHDFAEFTVKAGTEIRGLCQSWSLNNSEELWVSAVEFEQNVRSHHSIWTFAPPDAFPGPDGVWTCADRNYNELVSTLAGGILYAQSTQTEYEIQRFPSGAAVRVPPYSVVIGDVHLLNSSAQDVTGRAQLTLYSRPKSEVEIPLTPFEFDFHDLTIPARSRTRVSAECDLQKVFQNGLGIPFDMKIHYVLPHTHEYGTRFFIELAGGPRDGTTVIDSRGFQEEARGRFFEPPIETLGAHGLRFGCEYDNPTDKTLHYGWDEEMCQGLAFAESRIAFQGAVLEGESKGTNAEGMAEYTGPCEILAVEWEHDKPGGKPPE